MIIYTLGILEKNSKLLFLLRQNTKFFSGYYGLMGGKIEEDESPSIVNPFVKTNSLKK